MSDHKPNSLCVQLPSDIDLSGLLLRAADLNYSHNDVSHEIIQFKGLYNYSHIKDELMLCKYNLIYEINSKLQLNDIGSAIDILDRF